MERAIPCNAVQDLQFVFQMAHTRKADEVSDNSQGLGTLRKDEHTKK